MVKWKDLLEIENKWERKDTLWKYNEQIQVYEEWMLGALGLLFNWHFRDNNNLSREECNILTLAMCEMPWGDGLFKRR